MLDLSAAASIGWQSWLSCKAECTFVFNRKLKSSSLYSSTCFLLLVPTLFTSTSSCSSAAKRSRKSSLVTSASQVSSLFYLVPPVTAIFAYFLFGETLGLPALAGMSLTVVGVALATRQQNMWGKFLPNHSLHLFCSGP